MSNSTTETKSQWSKDNRWILYESVVYLTGKGLHYGGTWGPLLQPKAHENGVYCIYANDTPHTVSLVGQGVLDVFNPKSFDWIALQDQSDPALLKAAVSKLRDGGHLILINCEYTDEEFKRVRSHGFIQKQLKTDDENKLQILKAVAGGKKGIQTPKGGDPKKRACVVRFGAIGDLIMITPLIKELSKDGYEVTVLVQKKNSEILNLNPYIDNLLIQERDAIPNPELGSYEDYWKGQYDKFISLSESIEGSVLKVEGRRDYYTTKEERDLRHINYWDKTLEIGGYKVEKPRGELYFTSKEEKFAKEMTGDPSRFYILCPVKGSSWHKTYPILRPSFTAWLKDKPDVLVYLTGAGADAANYEWEDKQVHSLVNKLAIRDSLVLTKYVDLVVGPETGVMNGASCFSTPKIMFMSHSHPDSLSKYWENITCLEPDTPCYPCYQLHQSLGSCPITTSYKKDGQTILYKGPACTTSGKEDGAIPAVKFMKALDDAYEVWKNK